MVNSESNDSLSECSGVGASFTGMSSTAPLLILDSFVDKVLLGNLSGFRDVVGVVLGVLLLPLFEEIEAMSAELERQNISILHIIHIHLEIIKFYGDLELESISATNFRIKLDP